MSPSAPKTATAPPPCTPRRVAAAASFHGGNPAEHGFAVPDNPAYDETAAQRHWQALADRYGTTLRFPADKPPQ
ncbi:hypothetical protein ACFWY9_05380 [Amycolatopsis sp. NPDC059027]|uniref:hypothetical protein n=1 Tax=Amycolatopsis sp. NPDC059027 TaxID=3346709 RepID=UPI00366ED912